MPVYHPNNSMSLETWIGMIPCGMMRRRGNLPLARGSADSFALRANHYLHHGPPRPHTRPRTHTTPLHTTTLHSHLLPAHTAAPRSHLCFGCKQPAWGVPLGLASVFAKDSATLHIHPNHSNNTHKRPTPHPLAKYTKEPWLYPLPPLNKERSSVGRAKAPHKLASP